MSIVINFFGGPSSGKSTLMADVFAQLKWAGINCEMAPEFIKESVWEDRKKVFDDQYYVFGQQHYRLHRLVDEVGVILTDSPLILSSIYKPELTPLVFDRVVLDVFNSYNNINYFVIRKKGYNPKGRLQTEEEAIVKDQEIKDYITNNNLTYISIEGTHESAVTISQDIIKMIQGR